jgi:hypothetical protein
LTHAHVRLRPSRALAAALCLGHTAAIAGAWTALHPTAAALATLGLCLSAYASLRALAEQPRALRLGAEGRVDWVDRDGEAHSGRIRHASVPSWSLMTLTLDDGRVTATRLTLLPDCSERESLRRLRAWLGLHSRPARAPLPDAADSTESLTRG